jgi:sterol desaturase/sphingolipid hydroxylase (fatty acid hydroxylase superfamily)
MTLQALVVQHEIGIRLGAYIGIFSLMAIWELFAPRRTLAVSKWMRWTNNLGLVFFNTLILRVLFPVAAVGVAVFANNNGWGLLNYFRISYPLAIVLSVVALDLVIYFQHVLMHAVPTLWRLHRVHHADLDYDVTTGSRFHPLEIVLSMLIKFCVILILGAPAIGVLIFEVVLNAMAMFNHGNVGLPLRFDRVLRLLVVTPDMHRVHHSIEEDEANSNFGFNLSLWDRLFGTYTHQPREGHAGMKVGIYQYREPKQVALLPGMLALPFVGKVSDYTINRRE